MYHPLKLAIAAAALAATFVPSAVAQAGREQVSLLVPYSDLDMSTPLGGKTLLGRIEDAAVRVCRDDPDSVNPALQYVYRCRRKIVEATVRGADMRTLTLAWSDKGHVQGQATTLASR